MRYYGCNYLSSPCREATFVQGNFNVLDTWDITQNLTVSAYLPETQVGTDGILYARFYTTGPYDPGFNLRISPSKESLYSDKSGNSNVLGLTEWRGGVLPHMPEMNLSTLNFEPLSGRVNEVGGDIANLVLLRESLGHVEVKDCLISFKLNDVGEQASSWPGYTYVEDWPSPYQGNPSGYYQAEPRTNPCSEFKLIGGNMDILSGWDASANLRMRSLPIEEAGANGLMYMLVAATAEVGMWGLECLFMNEHPGYSLPSLSQLYNLCKTTAPLTANLDVSSATQSGEIGAHPWSKSIGGGAICNYAAASINSINIGSYSLYSFRLAPFREFEKWYGCEPATNPCTNPKYWGGSINILNHLDITKALSLSAIPDSDTVNLSGRVYILFHSDKDWGAGVAEMMSSEGQWLSMFKSGQLSDSSVADFDTSPLRVDNTHRGTSLNAADMVLYSADNDITLYGTYGTSNPNGLSSSAPWSLIESNTAIQSLYDEDPSFMSLISVDLNEVDPDYSVTPSAPESSSLSSPASFGEKGPVYAVDPYGWIYSIDPEGEKSAFLKDYFFPSYPVRGLAIKSQMPVEEPSSSATSEEEQQSSADEGRFVFYTVKNTETNKALISAFTGEGKIHGQYEITAYDNFIALEAWPSDDNFLVGITKNEFYFIDLDTSPPSVTIVSSDRTLDKGLALVEKLDDYRCLFAVPSALWPRDINHFILNRGNYSVQFSHRTDYALDENGPSLPMHVRGIGFLDGKLVSAHQKAEGYSTICFYADNERSCIDFMSILVTDIAIPISGFAEKQGEQEKSEIRVVTRQYNPVTGEFIGNVPELKLGTTQPNQMSDYQVVDIEVSGATGISNVQLGLVDYYLDEHTYAGNVFVGHASTFQATPPAMHAIPGVNEDGTIGDQNNISVGTRAYSSGEIKRSDFVYIAARPPKNFIGKGYYVLKWFFDFEEEVENLVEPVSLGILLAPVAQAG